MPHRLFAGDTSTRNEWEKPKDSWPGLARLWPKSIQIEMRGRCEILSSNLFQPSQAFAVKTLQTQNHTSSFASQAGPRPIHRPLSSRRSLNLASSSVMVRSNMLSRKPRHLVPSTPIGLRCHVLSWGTPSAWRSPSLERSIPFLACQFHLMSMTSRPGPCGMSNREAWSTGLTYERRIIWRDAGNPLPPAIDFHPYSQLCRRVGRRRRRRSTPAEVPSFDIVM